jgi:hypothetical protein
MSAGARLGAALGIVIAAGVASWWLGATRLALEQSLDAGALADGALEAAWLARALVLGLLTPRLGTLGGFRHGAACGLAATAMAWPLVASAALAGAVDPLLVLAGEGALAALALAGAAAGRGLAALTGTYAAHLCTALGAALGAAAWLGADAWPLLR